MFGRKSSRQEEDRRRDHERRQSRRQARELKKHEGNMEMWTKLQELSRENTKTSVDAMEEFRKKIESIIRSDGEDRTDNKHDLLESTMKSTSAEQITASAQTSRNVNSSSKSAPELGKHLDRASCKTTFESLAKFVKAEIDVDPTTTYIAKSVVILITSVYDWLYIDPNSPVFIPMCPGEEEQLRMYPEGTIISRVRPSKSREDLFKMNALATDFDADEISTIHSSMVGSVRRRGTKSEVTTTSADNVEHWTNSVDPPEPYRAIGRKPSIKRPIPAPRMLVQQMYEEPVSYDPVYETAYERPVPEHSDRRKGSGHRLSRMPVSVPEHRLDDESDILSPRLAPQEAPPSRVKKTEMRRVRVQGNRARQQQSD